MGKNSGNLTEVSFCCTQFLILNSCHTKGDDIYGSELFKSSKEGKLIIESFTYKNIILSYSYWPKKSKLEFIYL
jgi:hypothetical protein